LVQATDGNFYGTTQLGGAYRDGTVFKITPGGALTTLYSFCSQSGCSDGIYPGAALVQATNGDFYGTTPSGGSNLLGTVFKITPGGTLKTLYNFCSQSGCTDGYSPEAALVQATNGDFYGTTQRGGTSYDGGTVFKMTPGGVLTTLYRFCPRGGCADGKGPTGLVQSADGDFYGITPYGGAYYYGTVFRINPTGTLTTLYSFCEQPGCPDGARPQGVLVQATDGKFFGVTPSGGTGDVGTIFDITAMGQLTTLYNFCAPGGCTSGYYPNGALVQATDGDFYGTTQGGQVGSSGTIFSLSVGLRPFMETQPTSGNVGAVVKILGANLTGASSVTFDGTPAVFGVSSTSETEITTTVPAGATTGTVKLVTPNDTLSSNVPFRVLP
jgi:uncharacterized repeat protein (TIGR03803 family)